MLQQLSPHPPSASPTRVLLRRTNEDDDHNQLISTPSPRLSSAARKQSSSTTTKRPTSPFSRYSAPSLDPRTQSFFVYEAIKKRSANQLRKALSFFSPPSSLAEEEEQLPQQNSASSLQLFAATPLPTSPSTTIEPTATTSFHSFSSIPNDAVGRSPLFRACESGQLELVSILLDFYEQKYNEFGKFVVPTNQNPVGGGSSSSHATSMQQSMAVSQVTSRRNSTFVMMPNAVKSVREQQTASSISTRSPTTKSPAPSTSFTSLLAASKFLKNTSANKAKMQNSASTQFQYYVEPAHTKESQLNEAFLVACNHGTLDLVMMLLYRGANPNGPQSINDDQNSFGDSYGYRPIHAVAQRGFVKAITLMIRKGLKLKMKNDDPTTTNEKEEVEVVDSNGITAFSHACAEGQEKSALLLKMNGANVNAQDYSGFSVLHTAVIRNQKAIVKMLLNESKIDINTVATQQRQQTFLSPSRMIRSLQSNNNNNSNNNILTTTPLIDAIRLGHKRIVRLLLEHPKCDPCFTPSSSSNNNNTNTPLKYAVLCGNSKAVLRLVERMQKDFEDRYQEWNSKRQEHMKQVHYHERIHAAHCQHPNDEEEDDEERQVDESFFEQASSISSFYSSCHCTSGDQKEEEIFDEEGESEAVSTINRKDEEGETILFTAIRLGYSKIVRRLCRGKAPPPPPPKKKKVEKEDENENDGQGQQQSSSVKFRFANVTLKNNIEISPIELVRQRILDDLFKYRMLKFLEKKIPPKPKSNNDDDAEEDENDDNDGLKNELSMSDSMFIREWNEKQRQEILRKMKEDEEALLKAEREEEEERQRKIQAEEEEKKRKEKEEKEKKKKVTKKLSSKKRAEAEIAKMEEEEKQRKEEEEKKKQEEELKKQEEEKKRKEQEERDAIDPDEEEEEDESSDDDTVIVGDSDGDY